MTEQPGQPATLATAQPLQRPAQVVFEPGGYARFTGQTVPVAQRFASLVRVFSADLFRQTSAKLSAVLYLFAPIVLGAILVIRGFMPDLPIGAPGDTYTLWKFGKIPVAGQAPIDLEALGWVLAINAFVLLLRQATQVAPLIARDAHQGALLLYFSRPVLRAHYLAARLAAASLTGFALMLMPCLLLVLIAVSQHGLEPGGCPWPGWLGALWWLAVVAACAITCAAMALASSVTSLAVGVLVRNPSSAPLGFGGLILGSLAGSWVLQATWGRASMARALDLHHALQAPWTLLSWALDPQRPPQTEVSAAALGIILWTTVAGLGWWALQRFLADPPLGKGRA